MSTVDVRLVAQAFLELEFSGFVKPPAMRRGSDAEQKQRTLAAAQVWAADLQDLTAEEFLAAVRAFRRDPKNGGNAFWPRVGQIRALVPSVLVAECSDRSEEAWGRLLRLVQSCGHRALAQLEADGEAWIDGDPDLDALVKLAARSMGLERMATDPPDAMTAHRASFRRAFQQQQQERQVRRLASGSTTGLIEAETSERRALPAGGA